MAVNKRVNLTYKGTSYDVLVTMRLIEHIEEYLNLSRMASDLGRGDIKASHSCRLISILLEKGGAKIPEGELWDEVYSGGDLNPKDMMAMTTHIMTAIFPEPKKKSSILSKPQEKSKAKKITRGTNSIS